MPEEREPADLLAVLGTAEDGEYKNEWFGFGVLFEDSLFVTPLDEWDAEGLASAFSLGEAVNAFTAKSEDGASELKISVSEAGAAVTEAEFAGIMKALVPSALSERGLEAVKSKAETLSFAGEEHCALRCEAVLVTESGEKVSVCQLSVFVKSGRFIASVTATAYIEDSTDSILGGFYALA